jgi:hypothetical protein
VDSSHSQENTAKQIIDSKGNLVLALRGNIESPLCFLTNPVLTEFALIENINLAAMAR